MWEQVQETVHFIKEKTSFTPEYGIVLGSGLGSFTDEMIIEYTLLYKDIPHFPVSTVKGHQGALVFGTIGNKKVVAMQGRFHYYEGYSMQQVTFPIRVMKYLGIQYLIVSNAAGGVNPNYKVGSIVLINDHINMFPEHPLRGINDERFGERFINMGEAYSKQLIADAKHIAEEFQIEVHDGIYLGLQGPTFETLAEYRMVKILGADCVGMSTVPEVIVARHMKLETLGISVITDMGNENQLEFISHEEVLQAAKHAEPKVKTLIKNLILKAQ
jgi:purine-nucleoside phosphorylase